MSIFWAVRRWGPCFEAAKLREAFKKSKTTESEFMQVFLFAIWAILMTMSTQPVHAQETKNHLADSASPYLQQHVYNPVDWYPWGEEALKRAKEENKPIILSVGYSTCYWCHVMEREVFEHDDVAKIMNAHFINIKVDREERPDLDEVYMLATQMMTGRGGWPNNVLLTPDLEPFFAVTYMPHEAWKDMLVKASGGWTVNEKPIRAQAKEVMNAIQGLLSAGVAGEEDISGEIIDGHFSWLEQHYDSEEGGFGSGPRFPDESGLLFLLDYAALRGNDEALSMARMSLDKMMLGGLHDHVGGGFHRYCVDKKWRVPHFEKMLYNQALLARSFTVLAERTGESVYKDVADGIFDFTAELLTNDQGAFLSAIDAETDAMEGAYYVWSEVDLREALNAEEFRFVFDWYERADVPEIPGHKHVDGGVIYQPKSFAVMAQELNKDEEVLRQETKSIFGKLKSKRDARKLPRIDTKIISGWNGLMVDALARAGRIEQAEKAVRFVLAEMRDDDGNLYRIYAGGKAYQKAFFEDYAFMMGGLASLYKETNDEFWLAILKDMAARSEKLFMQESGKYALSDGDNGLDVKIVNAHDAAIPSGTSVLAHAYLDLFEAMRDPEWLDKAAKITKAYQGDVAKNPQAFAHLIHAAMRLEVLRKQKTTPGMRSEDRVKSSVVIEDGRAKVILDVEEGWHINANPASMDFLIPTEVSAPGMSPVYPDPEKMQTPLGDLSVYKGKVEIVLNVADENVIDDGADLTTIKIKTRFQACSEDTCLAPSSVNLKL